MSLMFGQRKTTFTRSPGIPCDEVVLVVSMNRQIYLLMSIVAVFVTVVCCVDSTKAQTSLKERAFMKMTVNANGNNIVFELNDSQAAKDLFAQLPLSIGVENYSSNEKIFSPPKKLKTDGTPLVRSARTGTLAYYAPWGNVVMFYGSFGSAAGLYELGHAVKGGDAIKALSGTIMIEGS